LSQESVQNGFDVGAEVELDADGLDLGIWLGVGAGLAKRDESRDDAG
jgi:hypothetical protein